MPREFDDAIVNQLGSTRLPGWMSRTFAAMTADLRLVDCGSLEVLLYCTDDVAVGVPGDRRLPDSAHLAGATPRSAAPSDPRGIHH